MACMQKRKGQDWSKTRVGTGHKTEKDIHRRPQTDDAILENALVLEINPKYSLEGLMLKLKLQFIGHLMRRADSLEKTLILGKTEGRKRRGRQEEMDGWHHRLHGHEFE